MLEINYGMMIIDKFLLNLNVITTFIFTFESIIKKLEKINTEGKKEIESLLNTLNERNMVQKSRNFTKKHYFSLFRNVDLFHQTVLEKDITTLFHSIRKKLEIIITLFDSYEKNFQFLMEYFTGLFGEKSKTVNFEVLQKELVIDLKRKEMRKFFLLMKMMAVGEKIKGQLRKDADLKKEVINLFEEKAEGRISMGEFEEDLSEEKHYLQLWIFRPYVDENIIDFFYIILKEFTKN